MIMFVLNIFAWMFVLYIGIVFIIASLATIYEISTELFQAAVNILDALVKITFSPKSYEFLTFKNFDTIFRRFIGCFNIFFRQIFNNIIGKKVS